MMTYFAVFGLAVLTHYQANGTWVWSVARTLNISGPWCERLYWALEAPIRLWLQAHGLEWISVG